MILAPAIPVLVIVAFFGALIFAVMGRQLSEGIVGWLKDAGRIAAFLAGPVGTISVKLTRWITHNVGAVFGDLERLTVTWFSAIYQYFDLVITNALEWPVYLWRFQRWLLFHELPKLAHAVPKLATQVVHSVTTRVVHVERTIVKLPKLSRAAATALVSAAVATYVHPFLSDLRWLRAHFHALTVALPHALPVPRGWTPTAIRRWVRKAIRADYATLAFAGAVAIALSRLGLGWLRCNSLRRIGKRIGCGGFGILEAILAGTLEGFALADLCGFTALLTAQTHALVPELMVLVDVENKLVGCHGATAPLRISLPPVSLPSLVDAVGIAA